MRYFALRFRVNVSEWILTGSMIFFMMAGKFAFSQNDVMFTQTSFNPAFVNPAYAGSDTTGLYNTSALYRSQATGLNDAPVTAALNINGPLRLGGVEGGINFTFISDKAGFLNTPSFSLGYAHKFTLGKGSLNVGLSVGMMFSTVEQSGWRLPDGGSDPSVPTGEGSKQNFDLGLGAYYNSEKWYAGLSVIHLTSPTLIQGDNSSKLPPNFYLMAGYRFPLSNPDLELNSGVVVLSDPGSFTVSLNAVMFYRKKFWAGIDYRHNSALSLIAGLNLLSNLRLGYSYGYNTTALSRFSGGNHEVMLTYSFAVYLDKGRQKYKSVRYL
jgi:type IX secretion system PorP/SprF family membrane protein